MGLCQPPFLWKVRNFATMRHNQRMLWDASTREGSGQGSIGIGIPYIVSAKTHICMITFYFWEENGNNKIMQPSFYLPKILDRMWKISWPVHFAGGYRKWQPSRIHTEIYAKMGMRFQGLQRRQRILAHLHVIIPSADEDSRLPLFSDPSADISSRQILNLPSKCKLNGSRGERLVRGGFFIALAFFLEKEVNAAVVPWERVPIASVSKRGMWQIYIGVLEALELFATVELKLMIHEGMWHPCSYILARCPRLKLNFNRNAAGRKLFISADSPTTGENNGFNFFSLFPIHFNMLISTAERIVLTYSYYCILGLHIKRFPTRIVLTAPYVWKCPFHFLGRSPHLCTTRLPPWKYCSIRWNWNNNKWIALSNKEPNHTKIETRKRGLRFYSSMRLNVTGELYIHV